MAPVELVGSQRAAAGGSALGLQPVLSSGTVPGAASAAPVQPEAERRGPWRVCSFLVTPGPTPGEKAFFSCAAKNFSANFGAFIFRFVPGGRGGCAPVAVTAPCRSVSQSSLFPGFVFFGVDFGLPGGCSAAGKELCVNIGVFRRDGPRSKSLHLYHYIFRDFKLGPSFCSTQCN